MRPSQPWSERKARGPKGGGRWGYEAWVFIVKSLLGFSQDIAYLSGKARALGISLDDLSLKPDPEKAEDVRQAGMSILVEALEGRIKELDDHPGEQDLMKTLLIEARRRKERSVRWWL